MAGGPFDPFDMGEPALPPPAIPPIAPIAPITIPAAQIKSFDDIGVITPIEARKSPIRTRSPPSTDPKYFLKGQESTDAMAFLGPVRRAVDVLPIVDGLETYYAMEEAIQQAKTSVLLNFWLFDPATPTVHDDKVTWLAMLIDAAKRGVTVCIQTTDRDPGFDAWGHFWAWKRYFDMYMATGSLPAGRFQLVCSRHPAEVPPITVKVIDSTLYDKVIDDLHTRRLEVRKDFWANAPAFWDKLDYDDSSGKFKRKKPGEQYPVFPASHHNKMLIVDGRLAFAGGMNIESTYIDDTSHFLLMEKPWHDCFVKVEGAEILADFLRCYAGLWNQERVRCEKFLTDAFAQRGTSARISKTTDLDPAKLLAPVASGVKATIPSQVHRTVTRKSSSLTGVPDITRRDILDGYIKAIGKAEKYIYLENQYIREKEMIDAIINQAQAQPHLRVILLMPKTIEELTPKTLKELKEHKREVDPVTLHGAWIQHQLLVKLRKAMRKRLGLFALVRNDAVEVYVHSKLIIVDDAYASIGSANTNPRSFRMDTELDFTWVDSKITGQLRHDLWNEVLGKPARLKSWKPRDFVDEWTAIADKNSGRGGVKKGMVVHYLNQEEGTKHAVDLEPFT